MLLSKLQALALWEFSTSRKFVPCRGNVATLRAEVSPLAWLLALTKSFAWLVSRVVGLSYTTQERKQTYYATDEPRERLR